MTCSGYLDIENRAERTMGSAAHQAQDLLFLEMLLQLLGMGSEACASRSCPPQKSQNPLVKIMGYLQCQELV